MANTWKERVQPRVLAVSGWMASGKTTVVEALAKRMGSVPSLIFDQYDQYTHWPRDMDAWIRNGADPNQVTIPRMKADLLALLEGKPIAHPLDQRTIDPAGYILIEEPFGRFRNEISGYIDWLVYIDVPYDVCVIRLVQRVLGISGKDFSQRIESESREALIARLQGVPAWLDHYQKLRSGLGLSQRIKAESDFVVDGLKPVGEIIDDILGWIGY